jgi:ComEC/Rec2-related protein
MVFSKTLFLFTALFLAGYYTPLHCSSQIWLAAIPAGIALAAFGLRKYGIIVLCIVSVFAGSYLDDPHRQLRSPLHSISGVWGCSVETTTTTGALLNTPMGYTVWSSNRILAESVSRGDSVLIIGSVNGAFLESSAFRSIPSTSLQDRLRRAASVSLSTSRASRKTSSLVSALLVGERGYLPPSVRQVFSDTGTSHLLALSGLHVGILSTMMLFISRKLFGKGWLSILTVILIAFIYVFVSGARASTVRAGVMLVLVLTLMHLSGRTPDLLFVWSVAVLFLTGVSSVDVLNNVGAQMSFGAVLSLIVLGRNFKGKPGWILSIGYAGVVVTVALAPLVSFTYGSMSSAAPIATVISVPFMLGTMLTGVLTLLFPFLSTVTILTEWIVFTWLGILEIFKFGRIVFLEWMLWVWPVCLITLWLFSRRGSFRHRFR